MAADDDDDSDASAGHSSERVVGPSGLSVAGPDSTIVPAEELGQSEEVLDSFQKSLMSLVQFDVLLKMQISAIEKSILDDSNRSQFSQPRDSPSSSNEDEGIPAQTSFLGFEKLSGKANYHQWSFLMRLVLERLDLWTTASEGAPPSASLTPSTFPVPGDDLVPDEKDLRVYSYISLSVCDYILPRIERHQSGRLAWRTLEHLYGEVTLLDRIMMERKLCARMKENQSIKRHIKRLLVAVEYLRWAGEKIDDNDVVRKILCSLPDSCDSFIRTLSSEQLSSSKNVIQAVLVLDQR